MNLASFLLSMAGPLVLRALTLLGIGTLTFTGVATGLQSLIDIAVQNWASFSGDILALVSIAGLPQAVGIITGAMTARVGMWVAISATKWILSPGS